MGIKVGQKKAGKTEHENEVVQVAEFDGQSYAFGFNMVRAIPDDGVGVSLASYSTSDDIEESTGVYGGTVAGLNRS